MTQLPDRRSLRRAIEALALFRDLFDDPIGQALREMSEEPKRAAATRLLASLIEEAELYPEELVGDVWQNHLLDRILASTNVLARKAERARFEAAGEGLIRQAQHEMSLLQQLFISGGAVLIAEIYAALDEEGPADWSGFRSLGGGPSIHSPEALAFKRTLAESTDWPSAVEALAAVYASAGVGIFSQFRAFRWLHADGGGRLAGVAHPDPVALSDLIGYTHEREPAIRNAERFAAGLPGNNVLLYGERGTGKSSTVKALLNEFCDQGLRLVEVAKEHLDDFPEIIGLLRHRRERFVLFVDDLSFEEQETNYKALKAILEGGIEARPDNMVLYATSNRRHLVREHFADRLSDGDEVHAFDTMEEKLSLSDRFGIRVTFGAPDQDRYLAIVRGIAQQRGIEMPVNDLERKALRWAQRERGRSGRTARQFVDALVGELAMP
jgi:predicted AAA+ superfamily ATPase